MLLFERTAVIYYEPVPTGWGSKTAEEMGRGSSPHPVADSLQVRWREWGGHWGTTVTVGWAESLPHMREIDDTEESVTEEGIPSIVGAADTQNPGK